MDCKNCDGKGTIFNDSIEPIKLAWFAMACPDCDGSGKDNIGLKTMLRYDFLNERLHSFPHSDPDWMTMWNEMKILRKQIIEALNKANI